MSALKALSETTKFVKLYQILGRKGYQHGIENHLSLVVDKHPMTNNKAIMTSKYGVDWSVVTEDDLFAIDLESKSVIDQEMDTQYEESFFSNMLSIHGGILMHREDIKCIIHSHPLSICTLTGLKAPCNKILNVHQNNVRFNSMNKIGYDIDGDGYTTFAVNELERFSELIGTDNDILMLANHGVVVTADCMETAFDRLYYLDIAAQIQVNIYATQKEMNLVPQHEVAVTKQTWTRDHERMSAIYHFAAAVNALNR